MKIYNFKASAAKAPNGEQNDAKSQTDRRDQHFCTFRRGQRLGLFANLDQQVTWKHVWISANRARIRIEPVRLLFVLDLDRSHIQTNEPGQHSKHQHGSAEDDETQVLL